MRWRTRVNVDMRYMRRPSLAMALLLATTAQPASAARLGIAESDTGARKHRDFAGKPCLQSEGIARPLVSNPRIMDHAVNLDNHCSDIIKVKVCYYRSDDCTEVVVPGYGRKEQIIGVFPAMQLFRYEVKEQF